MKTGIGALITAIMAMVAWVIKNLKMSRTLFIGDSHTVG